MYKEALEAAKRWLKSTVKKIGEIELNGHEFMKYWLGEDARVLQNTKEFFKQAKKELKRSYTLTKTQAANPRGPGVRSKKPGYSAKAYPSLPATLKETVEPGSNRTETWVQNTKQTTNKEINDGVKTKKSPNDDTTGQPPDYYQHPRVDGRLFKPESVKLKTGCV